jgi:hypothetical protein
MIQHLIRKTAEFLSQFSAYPNDVKMFPVDWLVDQISIREAENHDEVRTLNGWNAFKATITPETKSRFFVVLPKHGEH